MFATGMMDPNWWKYTALNHKWYRDDDAYADYSERNPLGASIGVNIDGARGQSFVTFPNNAASFEPSDDPFEVQAPGAFELKDSDGITKYKVTKLVCDKNTLTFTLLKLTTNEEVSVTMEIAPEGFTTDLFTETQETTTQETQTTVPAQQQSSPWTCPCGASNIGKFCTQCGHQRD